MNRFVLVGIITLARPFELRAFLVGQRGHAFAADFFKKCVNDLLGLNALFDNLRLRFSLRVRNSRAKSFLCRRFSLLLPVLMNAA
jgi:hypothetical protein